MPPTDDHLTRHGRYFHWRNATGRCIPFIALRADNDVIVVRFLRADPTRDQAQSWRAWVPAHEPQWHTHTAECAVDWDA